MLASHIIIVRTILLKKALAETGPGCCCIIKLFLVEDCMTPHRALIASRSSTTVENVEDQTRSRKDPLQSELHQTSFAASSPTLGKRPSQPAQPPGIRKLDIRITIINNNQSISQQTIIHIPRLKADNMHSNSKPKPQRTPPPLTRQLSKTKSLIQYRAKKTPPLLVRTSRN